MWANEYMILFDAKNQRFSVHYLYCWWSFDQSSKTRGNEYVHCDCVGQLKYLERLFKYLETLPNTEYERSECNSIIIPFIDIMWESEPPMQSKILLYIIEKCYMQLLSICECTSGSGY